MQELLLGTFLYLLCLTESLVTSDTIDYSQQCPGQRWAYNKHDLLEEFVQDVSSPARLLDVVSLVAGDYGNSTRYNISYQCSQDVMWIIEAAVLHREKWAIKFLDAWGKPPSGVLQGDLVWAGSYGECVALTSPTAHTTTAAPQHIFVGKYCSVQFRNISFIPQSIGALTEGVCLPDSCSDNDIQNFITMASSSVNQSGVHMMHQVKCQPTRTEGTHVSAGAIAMLTILSILGLLTLLGTSYDVIWYQSTLEEEARSLELTTAVEGDLVDVAGSTDEYTPLVAHRSVPERKQTGFVCRVLLCFSVYTNTSKILSVGPTNEESLSCFHGIRVLSMTWIILAHTYYYGYLYPAYRNLTEVLSVLAQWSSQLIIGASLAVDTFFLLSGTLVAYLTLKKLTDKGGPRHFNWILFYLHRIWRITPAYMFVLGLYAAFYQYLGEGPFWAGEKVVTKCKTMWWTNLLYIQNFWKAQDQCLGWMWYLANDMQFYVLSPLVIVLLYLKAWVGVFTCLCLLSVSWLSTGLVSSTHHHGPGIQGLIHSLTHTNTSSHQLLYDFYFDLYQRPWTRIGPYLIGLMLGWLLHKTGRKQTLRWGVVGLGWLLMAVCTLGVLLGLQGIIQGTRSINNDSSALFNALFRSVWALGIAWLVFACVHGYGGIVNRILSWPALIPLSRLTFMAYLVHPAFVLLYYQQMKQRLVYDTMTVMYIYMGNLMTGYLSAFVVSLLFEAPMISLEKLLLKRTH